MGRKGATAARADRFGTVANKLVGELIAAALYRKCLPPAHRGTIISEKIVYFSIACENSAKPGGKENVPEI